MKILYRILFALHAFVGVGALAGGMAAILDPQEPLGMSSELLRNSPFDSYLIPGLILFSIIGLGNVISAVSILLKSKCQGYISNVFSWALVIWIVVQVVMLKNIHFLHVIFFIIGITEAGLSAAILFEQKLFPANLILNYYNKITKEM